MQHTLRSAACLVIFGLAASAGLLIAQQTSSATSSMGAQLGPAPSRVVAGLVVDAANDVPLRRARVTVSSGSMATTVVLTDDEGRFRLETTLPRPLTVRVTKAAFAASVAVVASDAVDLRIALERSAAIGGTVLDQHGAPVSAAYVTARGIAGRDGSSSIAPGSRFFSTQTDELGEYRLGALPPGRYEITAFWLPPSQRQPQPDIDMLLSGPNRPQIITRPSALTLAPGDDLADVAFTLTDVPPSCPRERATPAIKGTASISGHVTGSSGEALCAIVRIVAPEDDRVQLLTDEDGRYTIADLPAGSFIIEADPARASYATLLYGQRRPSDNEVAVAVRAGEHREGADLVLPRKGIVSGTVVDEHGEPMESAQVEAIRLLSFEGRLIGAVGGLSRATDDRGRYRVTGLDAGNYVLKVSATGDISPRAAGGVEGYATAFYPSTSEVSSAQRIVLDVDADMRNIDIIVAPTPMATVSGIVVDERGHPLAATVTMTVSGRSGGPVLETRSARSDVDGAFAIRHVPPGEYAVKAIGTGPGTQPFGMRYVRIADGQPVDVSVMVAPQSTLKGRMIVEGIPEAEQVGINVRAYSADVDQSPASALNVRTYWTPSGSGVREGMFFLGGVSGPSRLSVEMPRCERCYVKSVMVNGVDAADRPFDFGLKGGAYQDAEIVVSPAGVSLEGRAGDPRTTVAAPVTVVVFPVNTELWYARSRHVKAGTAAADGSFQVTGLPPGEYLVAAIATSDSKRRAALTDQNVLDDLSTAASRVVLTEGQRQFLELKHIGR